MKLSPSLASEFLPVRSAVDGSYDALADEYYDEVRHPTCADFRSASRIYLDKLFEDALPRGRIAEIGCGLSLLAEFNLSDLVLVDKSHAMLGKNSVVFERRLIDVEVQAFGEEEFDWVFAILADPYNTPPAWRNIAKALKKGGNCVFVVPSITWVKRFRTVAVSEKMNCAAFVTREGETLYAPSFVRSSSEQKKLIHQAGLNLVAAEHVYTKEMREIRSSKISKFLNDDEPVLDAYRAKKQPSQSCIYPMIDI